MLKTRRNKDTEGQWSTLEIRGVTEWNDIWATDCWTDGQTVGQMDRPWDRWTDCVTYGQTVETDGQTSHIEGHRRPVDRQTDW